MTRRLLLACATVLVATLPACKRAEAPRQDTQSPATATLPAGAETTLRSPDAGTVDDPRRERDSRLVTDAFRGDETLASLRARFGDANVRVETIPGAEGEETRGVVLFPDDPTRRAYLHFADTEKLEGLALVRIVDSDSTWRFDNIRMGTTLAELVAQNGAPVEFSGFGWDYGGAIAGFRGGALEPRDSTWPRTAFRLSPREDLGEDMLKLPQGDGTFSSDDPASMQHATDIVVGELTLAFPRQAPTDPQSSNR